MMGAWGYTRTEKFQSVSCSDSRSQTHLTKYSVLLRCAYTDRLATGIQWGAWHALSRLYSPQMVRAYRGRADACSCAKEIAVTSVS